MQQLSTPLTDEELFSLDQYLLYEVDAEEGMVMESLDGYLHAIAIGPTTLSPAQWMPKIWGLDAMLPPVDSIEQANHLLHLIMRHFNGIVAGLEMPVREISPYWASVQYRGREYDDAEIWAHGFWMGMQLCWKDWQPMLDMPQGQAWYRPIHLLGAQNLEDGGDEELTRTPARRARLAAQIPQAVLEMHAFWLPLRHAVVEREVAKAMRSKAGRNDSCPCGSGIKFKKCHGAPENLH